MDYKTALKAEFTCKAIEGRIRGLAKQLFRLATDPDNQGHRGPLFVSLNAAFKPAAEYDGMAGSLMLEGFLGAAIGDSVPGDGGGSALSFLSASDFDLFTETLSEYAQYADEKKRGQGTYGLGEHKTICNQFDGGQEDAVRAYARDLLERMNIESAIAALSKALCAAAVTAQQPEIYA
jgi:hypothetical protein